MTHGAKKIFLKGFDPKPVQSSVPWMDDRPGPGAMHHGVYTPVMRVGSGKKPLEPSLNSIAFQMPKKPRGTV